MGVKDFILNVLASLLGAYLCKALGMVSKSNMWSAANDRVKSVWCFLREKANGGTVAFAKAMLTWWVCIVRICKSAGRVIEKSMSVLSSWCLSSVQFVRETICDSLLRVRGFILLLLLRSGAGLFYARRQTVLLLGLVIFVLLSIPVCLIVRKGWSDADGLKVVQPSASQREEPTVSDKRHGLRSGRRNYPSLSDPLAEVPEDSIPRSSPKLRKKNSSVLTHHNDPERTGANLNEIALNTSNVNSVLFGKLFSLPIDGCIYAQPLYVPNVVAGGVVHNVVYIATEHNSVYAYDADDPATTKPLWHVNLGAPVPSTDISPIYTDLTPEIGITGTPVIDPTTGTLYVVAKSKDSDGYRQKLHALDITTGSERFNGPVEINATVSGTGDGNVDGTIGFSPLQQLNRPGLLLQNGIVYVAFGSHGDSDPYHGWVMGYQAATLQQIAVYNTTPDGGRGAIWMSGQGISGDSVNVYVTTGNGTCDADLDCGRNLGESFIKLTAALTPADWFTPRNRGEMDQIDLDVGSGGLLLLPNTSYAAAAGKDGILRLVDTNSMGRFNAEGNQDIQEFRATTDKLLGAPVYWTGPKGDDLIYLWGDGDSLKAYRFASGHFWTTPASQSLIKTPYGISNSAALSLSANGSEAGTGIVWAVCSGDTDRNPGVVHGILRAFDASDLSVELWDSLQDSVHNDAGLLAKFCPPTVANGKVYVATSSGQLNVYGLRS